MKNFVLAVLAIVAIAFIVLYVKERRLAGGGTSGAGGKTTSGKKNDLEDIDCNKHDPTYQGPTYINVDDQYGIPYKYEAIFVCQNETVQWRTTGNVTNVEVDFNPLNWPFVESFQKLTATPNNPTKLVTVKGLDPGYRIQPRKYTIIVTTTNGPLPTLDPHIIPMGP